MRLSSHETRETVQKAMSPQISMTIGQRSRRVLARIWGMMWRQRKLWAELLVVFSVLLAINIIIVPHINRDKLQHLIQGVGVLGPLFFLGISATLVVLFAPPILSIGLGSLAFGKITGGCYSLLGITAGTCFAFLLGRHLLGDSAAKFKHGKLKRIDEIATSNGLLSIIGLRLAFFNFAPLNYAVGATAVTFKTYVLGTLIGLLPRTFALSFVFDILQEPRALQAPLLHPSSSLLLLLPLSRLAGIWLLATLARHRGRDTGIQR
jgi:uncharacterized membrane protein YdjX (TVP38/TMEM64 family)